ncbi:CPA1 family monovalent cation:H+ antiporter [Luteibacter sp. Sphag1AF]|uniref:Na+/H+ antiporter n=1 Tax=Luteibacter sp. Sphag1AF TaxID=2587031 RepID=UPI00161EF6A1|nr:Na+/H+ antiporter [Luteibacter sp. Sphag1AF]MBB3226452.1 CPA1 family monovalent cation:H+ antiporter [Luteibacter sp. Sphag1AF]
MTSTDTFKFVLILLVAIVALELIARRLRLPTAAALLAGGIGIAFLPGVPPVTFDPELVLVVFLPPLLMDGAFYTVWADFRRYLGGILWLAVGAVIFTTLVVGATVHWVLPSLPWAACFALGAVVSPPDAVAAKAVLGKVRLPRRLMVLLEGESLLNDATGLVLFRFAVAAALTGAFSAQEAVMSFGLLALGGIAVGAVIGFAVVQVLKRIDHMFLAITVACLSPWAAYIGGESVHVSGVMSVVTAGIIFGWFQHEIFSANVRVRATSFWGVMIFLLEALVFILIGFSLRGVVQRLGGLGDALHALGYPILAVLAAVIVSRFLWVYATDYLRVSLGRLVGRRPAPPSPRGSFLLSWAGMRGVVTLAIALSLPEAMPGRDLTLAAAFAVILVTVVVQGGTMAPIIRWLGLDRLSESDAGHLNEGQAGLLIDKAQLAVIHAHAHDSEGRVIHPRLLEQYSYRVKIGEEYNLAPANFAGGREAHYTLILEAIRAGRAELLRLHRSGQIHDELLHYFERDLDLQQISAENDRAGV